MSAARPAPVTTYPVSIPATVAHFEMFDNSLVGAGVLKGDTAVVLLDSEVRSEDLVLVHTPEGLQVLQYHSAPAGRVKLRTVEFQKSRRWVYGREDAVILGRVLQFQCGGKVVQTLVALRAVC